MQQLTGKSSLPFSNWSLQMKGVTNVVSYQREDNVLWLWMWKSWCATNASKWTLVTFSCSPQIYSTKQSKKTSWENVVLSSERRSFFSCSILYSSLVSHLFPYKELPLERSINTESPDFIKKNHKWKARTQATMADIQHADIPGEWVISFLSLVVVPFHNRYYFLHPLITTDNLTRGLRACLRCALIKTYEQVHIYSLLMDIYTPNEWTSWLVVFGFDASFCVVLLLLLCCVVLCIHQFVEGGCENCDFLGMQSSTERVIEVSTVRLPQITFPSQIALFVALEPHYLTKFWFCLHYFHESVYYCIFWGYHSIVGC